MGPGSRCVKLDALAREAREIEIIFFQSLDVQVWSCESMTLSRSCDAHVHYFNQE